MSKADLSLLTVLSVHRSVRLLTEVMRKAAKAQEPEAVHLRSLTLNVFTSTGCRPLPPDLHVLYIVQFCTRRT